MFNWYRISEPSTVCPDTPRHLALVSIQTHACVPCSKVCLVVSVPCAQVLVLLLVHHPTVWGASSNRASKKNPRKCTDSLNPRVICDFFLYEYIQPRKFGQKKKMPLRNRVQVSRVDLRWMSCMYNSNSVMVGSSVDLRELPCEPLKNWVFFFSEIP